MNSLTLFFYNNVLIFRVLTKSQDAKKVINPNLIPFFNFYLYLE